MIVVAEPTYSDDEHAAVNNSLVRALTLACGPAVFAATRAHHAAVRQVGADGVADTTTETIDVVPPGGVHLRRMQAQWQVLSGLVRRHRPKTLVLLSAGPETLFVARLLVARFRSLHVFAIMHGNLATVVGWRSRDPRRRLIDLRTGLRVAEHPRIKLIVLEDHIKQAAGKAGLRNDFLVWPLPVVMHERVEPTAWTLRDRLRLTFVGSANRRKGFADVLALKQLVGSSYDWAVAGELSGEFRAEDVAGFEVPSERLSRMAFVAEVRRADYAIVSFGPEYMFTASGSLMDCIAQRKPMIAVANVLLDQLQAKYGPVGHVARDQAELVKLLGQHGRLRDASAYAGFQRALDAIHADRLPSRLAVTMGTDLAC